MEMVTVACPKCKGNLQVDSKHDRIFCMYCRAEVIVKKPKSKESNRAESLIKKGFLALEHREWGKARKALNKAAEIEPENAQIYVGLLMAETGCPKEEELGFIEHNHSNILINGNLHKVTVNSLSEMVNYKKAERFADNSLKVRLQSYNDQLIAIETEVRQRKNWKIWVTGIPHALIYPYIMLEILYLIAGDGWFHFTRVTFNPNRRFFPEFFWINIGVFAFFGLMALLLIYKVKKDKLRTKVIEEFRMKIDKKKGG